MHIDHRPNVPKPSKFNDWMGVYNLASMWSFDKVRGRETLPFGIISPFHCVCQDQEEVRRSIGPDDGLRVCPRVHPVWAQAPGGAVDQRWTRYAHSR